MIGTTVQIGYVPFLNMVPFHQGFGPVAREIDGIRFEFKPFTPRALGQEAAMLRIDAGALSLADLVDQSVDYERLGTLGIGVQGPAQSVLLFSRRSVRELRDAVVAISEETSTSGRLLQLLLEKRYGLTGLKYGRVASGVLFDGGADALLLIGDDALRARASGVPGFPCVTDLGTEWLVWQQTPFVFAHWAVKRSLPQVVKKTLQRELEKSLLAMEKNRMGAAAEQAIKRAQDPQDVITYWNGFSYRLTAEHEKSVEQFTKLLEEPCSTS